MAGERISGLGLRRFEEILHRRHKKITLSSEIKDCFEYFEAHSPKALGSQPVILIHGNGITLRKVTEGRDILLKQKEQ